MKTLLRNLVLLFSSLVIVLVAAEYVIRWLQPQQLIVPNDSIWRPDNEVGWRHVENANTEINTGEGRVHFVTDDDGYRIDYPRRRRVPVGREINILVIGDSYIEAAQVENRNAIPALLEDSIQSRLGKSTRVVNDGVGGWSPNQYLKEARTALSKQDYDLGIVFLYVGNDIIGVRKNEFSPTTVSSRHRFHWPRGLGWEGIVDAILYPINDALEVRSHLFVFFKARLRVLLARMGLTAAFFPPVFALSEAESIRWEVTTAVCKDIRGVFDDFTTSVLFVLLPTPYQVHEDEFYAYLAMFDVDADSVSLDQPNRLLAEHFGRDSLPLIDVLEPLRAEVGRGRLFGRVDGHFNATGHEVVANHILEQVLARILDGTRKMPGSNGIDSIPAAPLP